MFVKKAKNSKYIKKSSEVVREYAVQKYILDGNSADNILD